MVWLYTFVADGSWAQSVKYDGTDAKCRVRYKPNVSGPRARIHGAAEVKMERRLMFKPVK